MLGHYFFGIAIFVTSVFLVLLVLVQRGRGGGLVGALGGPGGQSALGTKAGDVFTRITIVVAAIWIFLCAAAVRTLNPSNTDAPAGLTKVTATMGDDKAAGAGAGDATKSDAPATPDSATTPGASTGPAAAATPAATAPATPDAKPAEPAAAPATPPAAETKPAEPAPAAEVKPAEPKAEEKPAEPKPDGDKPAEPTAIPEPPK